MRQFNGLNPGGIRNIAYNVYCGYLHFDHNILWSCRRMCNPSVGTENHTSSNPHQISWSQLQARSAASNIGSVHDAVIGGIALAILFIAVSLI